MEIIVKNQYEITKQEFNRIKLLTFKNGAMLDYYKEAKLNEEINTKLKGSTKVILAKHNNTIIGWALYSQSYNSNKKYNFTIYVSKKYRNKGIGKQLLNKALTIANSLKHTIAVFPHDTKSFKLFNNKNVINYYTGKKITNHIPQPQ